MKSLQIHFPLLGIALATLAGCADMGRLNSLMPGIPPSSQMADEMAGRAMHQEIEYKNTAKPGSVVIALPGQIKSTNATFTQKLTGNNIADYAEIELSMANFKVLERVDIGPLLDELSFAVNLGNLTSSPA